MSELVDTLKEVLREHCELVSPFLKSGKSSQRSHVFLGTKGYIDQPVFNRHGTDKLQPCLLSAVYNRLYPAKHFRVNENDDKLPLFEHYRIDCIYCGPRILGKGRFPVEWTNDYLIEVENNLLEFRMTLRALLDVIAKKRVAIFFRNSPDAVNLSEQFLSTWHSYRSAFPGDSDPNLEAVFFPEDFANIDTYLNNMRRFIWDVKDLCFRAAN
jgi:hypothetical protein